MKQEQPEEERFSVTFSRLKPSIQKILIEFMKDKSDQCIGDELDIHPRTVGRYITEAIKEFKIHQQFYDHDRKGRRDELKALLKRYKKGVDRIKLSNEIRDYNSQKLGKIFLIIEGDLDRVSKKLILNILEEIKQRSGDNSITISLVEISSIKLTLTGTVEGCQRLKSQFDAGELTEILDNPILDVSSVEVITEDNLWTNLRNWLQSNIIPDWDLEEIVGGTIAALKANPNFLATPAFGSRMSTNDEEESTSIPELLTNLNSEDINIVRLAAQQLGEIEANTPEVVNSLKEKLNTIEDIQTQWQIALTLDKLAPEEHPQAKAQKQTIELGNTSLELIVATKNNEDDFVDILVEIRPDWDEHLPLGLEAKILEESGEEFWQDEFVSIRQVIDEQSYIYFSFWGTPGDRFILQLSLENTILQKNFQI